VGYKNKNIWAEKQEENWECDITFHKLFIKSSSIATDGMRLKKGRTDALREGEKDEIRA